MVDYLPKFKPGQAITRTASAAITGGQVVVVTGSGTVGPSTAITHAFVGVAAHDAAIGQEVTVFKGGIQRPLASAAITAGDIVVCAAAGRVVTNAAPGAGQQVGIALTTQAAAGSPVEVDFIR
jgi:predicted RecA/RadA family phage recombinase